MNGNFDKPRNPDSQPSEQRHMLDDAAEKAKIQQRHDEFCRHIDQALSLVPLDEHNAAMAKWRVDHYDVELYKITYPSGEVYRSMEVTFPPNFYQEEGKQLCAQETIKLSSSVGMSELEDMGTPELEQRLGAEFGTRETAAEKRRRLAMSNEPIDPNTTPPSDSNPANYVNVYTEKKIFEQKPNGEWQRRPLTPLEVLAHIKEQANKQYDDVAHINALSVLAFCKPESGTF